MIEPIRFHETEDEYIGRLEAEIKRLSEEQKLLVTQLERLAVHCCDDAAIALVDVTKNRKNKP